MHALNKPNSLISLLLVLLFLASPLLLAACQTQDPPLAQDEPQPLPTANPAGITHLLNLAVAGAITADDITAADDIVATDDLTVTDDSLFSGLVTLGGTTLAVTNDSTLTPASSYYHLDAATNVTTTLAACATNGQLLILYGDDNYNVIIADTRIRTSNGAAITLGQFDIVMFVCDDTEWIELALLTNS